MTRWIPVLATVLLLAAVPGCGSGQKSSGPSAPAGEKIVVFAAASLKKSFTEIGDQFSKDNPGASVEFSFAGSADLVTQLTQGAHADVFASADTKNMDKAAKAGLLAGDPVNFASNTLTIAVAPGNPKAINSFRDLSKPGLNVVVCAPQVPCGSAAQKVEAETGVTLNPVSEESSVTDVLNKVSSGQADAGLVYVTDTAAAGDEGDGGALPRGGERGEHLPDRGARASRKPRPGNEVRRSGDRFGRPADPGQGRFRQGLKQPPRPAGVAGSGSWTCPARTRTPPTSPTWCPRCWRRWASPASNRRIAMPDRLPEPVSC